MIGVWTRTTPTPIHTTNKDMKIMADQTDTCPPHWWFVKFEDGKEVGTCAKCGIKEIIAKRVRFKPVYPEKGKLLGISRFKEVEDD